LVAELGQLIASAFAAFWGKTVLRRVFGDRVDCRSCSARKPLDNDGVAAPLPFVSFDMISLRAQVGPPLHLWRFRRSRHWPARSGELLLAHFGGGGQR